jgi:AraC-like DNA-binding protein
MEHSANLKMGIDLKSHKVIVLPRIFLNGVSRHPLAGPVYPTDIGYLGDAQNHYINRSSGCGENILIYCMSGEGFLALEDKQWTIGRNSLLVIPAGVPHVYGASKDNPWSILWIHFLGSNAPCYFEVLSPGNPVLPVPAGKLPKILELFEELIRLMEKGYTHNSFIYASQLLGNLLGWIFYADSGSRSGAGDDSERVEESISHMAGRLGHHLTLRELAAQANLSTAHYSAVFRKKTGFSPIDYFLQMKIQKACLLLDTSGMKIKEIASGLGFSDPYYFCRAFRKIMQLSPSAYRDIKKG